MSSESILASDLFKKCIDFHGHLCPGLSLGYQAATAGMDWRSAHRAEDEEIVAIVETDACGLQRGPGNHRLHLRERQLPLP